MLQVDGIEAVADMGGSILTGIDGNPLAVLARQLHIPMHEIEQTEVPHLFFAVGTFEFECTSLSAVWMLSGVTFPPPSEDNLPVSL